MTEPRAPAIDDLKKYLELAEGPADREEGLAKIAEIESRMTAAT
ncbi:MAG TPA: hypothetical protein VGS22_23895 [Thermoanaerobaculia bacterium]|nr:hypothetical protein [Thermoanaerobaculia bacterium]